MEKITTLQEILALPQDKKDALLIMALDRMATRHKVFPDEMRNIDRMTAGNFMHNIAYIKQNLTSFNELSMDFMQQANIDFDALAEQTSDSQTFHFVLNRFYKAFPETE